MKRKLIDNTANTSLPEKSSTVIALMIVICPNTIMSPSYGAHYCQIAYKKPTREQTKRLKIIGM